MLHPLSAVAGYRGPPTPAPVGGPQRQEKEEQPDAANSRVVSQYTDQVEDQHSYIKETVDTVFPSNIRVLQGVLDKIRLKILKLEKAIQTQREQCKQPCKTKCPIPVVSGKECEDIFRRGGKESQMYLIQLDPFFPPYKLVSTVNTLEIKGLIDIFNIFFIFLVDGFSSRTGLDGSVDFGRRCDDYRRRFGNIAFDVGKGHCETPGEYWLVHAQYNQFTIQSESSNYVMAVDGYSGNAGNCFLEGSLQLFGENRTMTIHNGMMFSTYDRDNDNWIPGHPSKQCSREDGGGWWYNRCHSANPNGRYYIGGPSTPNMAK
ncbi:fibrinogen beta chain [Lates japonicus]|uniref:Fibrinogen beta chain n=1 Tax=Lates japonicus TaxID=270547 RepID=A0AAD3RHM1_LATJO|nr:fibrinogen beta chain [Lates japonicus]